MSSTTNNYFKVNREPFFFNDTDLASTRRAFDAASDMQRALRPSGSGLRGPRLTVWKRPPNHGPWSEVCLIGETL